MRTWIASLAVVVFVLSCASWAKAVEKKNSAKPAAASKAIGVEKIRAVEHVGSDRYALVIGIDDYQDDNIPDLTTCQADAAAMYELLTDPAKGGIKKSNAYLLLGEKATARNIKKYLGKLRQIPSKSTVFIYFSGHGAKEAEDAYWVTQDAEIDSLISSGLANTEIDRLLSKIPSDRVVVMVDCCYAAATVKGGKAVIGDFSNVLKQFTGKGRAYLMAASSGQEAIEAKDLRRSVFSHYLIEGLNGRADDNKDGVVVLTEIATYIDKHVADEARIRGGIQRPVVRMDNVSEPSKFGLTVYPEGLIKATHREVERQKQIEKDMQVLRKLYYDKRITSQQFQLGERLIRKHSRLLGESDKKRKLEFYQLINGTLLPQNLQMALDVLQDEPAKPAAIRYPAKDRENNRSVDSIIDRKLDNTLGDANSILNEMKELLNDQGNK